MCVCKRERERVERNEVMGGITAGNGGKGNGGTMGMRGIRGVTACVCVIVCVTRWRIRESISQGLRLAFIAGYEYHQKILSIKYYENHTFQSNNLNQSNRNLSQFKEYQKMEFLNKFFNFWPLFLHIYKVF